MKRVRLYDGSVCPVCKKNVLKSNIDVDYNDREIEVLECSSCDFITKEKYYEENKKVKK